MYTGTFFFNNAVGCWRYVTSVLGERDMSVGHWWTDTDGKYQSCLERETCPSATLPATNPKWIELSSSPGLGDEKPLPRQGPWTLPVFPCLEYRWQHVSITRPVPHLNKTETYTPFCQSCFRFLSKGVFPCCGTVELIGIAVRLTACLILPLLFLRY